MSSTIPVIEVMTSRDVLRVVAVHLDAFPTFFLSTLGPHFLRVYYSGIVTDEAGIAFVARSDEQVVGFVVGAIEVRTFYRRLRNRSWWRFALAALPVVLRRPKLARRLLRGLSHPETHAMTPTSAGLFSLAVTPAGQGHGIGGALVASFLREAARRGAQDVRLTTDADNNDAVNRFYARQAFTIERTFTTPEGRRMHEYVLALSRKSQFTESDAR